MDNRSHNVLDLRRIREEQSTPPRRRTRGGIHRPARSVQIAWGQLGREYAKYGIGLLIGGLVVLGVWTMLQAVRGLQATATQAKAGVDQIEQGVMALNQRRQSQAISSFQQATADLRSAQAQLTKVVPGGTAVARLVPYVGPRYTAANQLLQAASAAAQAGRVASQVGVNPDTQTGLTVDTDGIIRGNLGWLAVLATDPDRLQTVTHNLLESYRLVANVNAATVPGSMRGTLEAWQRIGRGLFGSPERLNQVVQLVLGITTQNDAQEYLVLFQNNDELRATGGFLGSYALIKFQRGTFTITDAPGNGPYALKDQLPATIRPPVPLDQVTSNLAFQDANWFADAPASAALITELYRQARGFAPDGVIFMTPDLIQFLLTVTGPVSVGDNATTVTAESFVQTLEEEAELHYDRSLNAPKQIIIQLLPAILNRLKSLPMADALRAFTMVMAEADRGNIMLVSQQSKVKQASAHLGWDGQFKTSDTDSLALISSNINGGKTDRFIANEISVSIQPRAGDWEHIVTIHRHHNGSIDKVLHNAVNTSYLRLMVPAGANLVSLEGTTSPPDEMFISPNLDTKPLALVTEPSGLTLSDPIHRTIISHEAGGTTFGFWSSLGPDQDQTIILKYTVPQETILKNGQWTLNWRRQPGTVNQQWAVTVKSDKASFHPAVPSQGWEERRREWSWHGTGDYSMVLGGEVKLK